MPLTIRDTSVTQASALAIISTNGNDLAILAGVNVAITGNSGVAITASEVSLQIDGSLIAAGGAIYQSSGTDARVVVGATGILRAFESSSDFSTILLQQSADLVNHGQISGPEAIGAILSGGNGEVFNTGSITGTTGLQFGMGAGSGDRLVNYGEIVGTGSFDFDIQAFKGRGVVVQNSGASILNGEGGRIVSTAPGGTGILGTFGATDIAIENHGEIASLRGTGIDLLNMFAGVTRLVNSGVISGQTTAYLGTAGTDRIFNTGTMRGDVGLGASADRYEAAGAGVIDGALNAGPGADTVILGAQRGSVFGGGDADLIRGGDGDDTLMGEDGADTLTGGEGADSIVGGDGIDVVNAGDGDDTVDGGIGNDNIRGAAGADNLAGGADADFVAGGADDDTVAGGAGADSMFGNGGDDVLQGGTEADTVSGNAGEDAIFGEDGADVLNGGTGDDALDGGLANDVLRAGAGEDTLTGGAGFDTQTGGSGADIFRFVSVAEIGLPGAATETITDFDTVLDLIDLVAIDANTTLANNQAFTFIAGAAFAGVAGQLRYVAATGALSGDVNGDSAADFTLVLSNRPAALTAGDVLL